MRAKLENWIFNVLVGKLAARAAISIVALVASTKIQAAMAFVGIHGVEINPIELAGAMVIASHSAFEWFKAMRMKSPNSPAVQTDASKPGADIPASAILASEPKL